jgi:hypothetical protein
MKQIIYLSIFTFVTFISLFGIKTERINTDILFESISAAFQNADSHNIVIFFDNNTEIDILGKEGIYNKEQAEQVLKVFFNKNAPKSFIVLFEGGSEYAKYAVAKLITNEKTYRINFLIKSKQIIHLKIELENEN